MDYFQRKIDDEADKKEELVNNVESQVELITNRLEVFVNSSQSNYIYLKIWNIFLL